MQKSLVVCLVLLGTASAVSPVGKVIELLDDLKGKVQNDLAKEGAAMEEYSGWCETEQSDYTYAIKTATSKIADLSAAMADNEAQASAFATQISELGSTIASKETELAEAGEMRKDMGNTYRKIFCQHFFVRGEPFHLGSSGPTSRIYPFPFFIHSGTPRLLLFPLLTPGTPISLVPHSPLRGNYGC